MIYAAGHPYCPGQPPGKTGVARLRGEGNDQVG